jgi:hypothetical protein
MPISAVVLLPIILQLPFFKFKNKKSKFKSC